jgi:hypothetical protein
VGLSYTLLTKIIGNDNTVIKLIIMLTIYTVHFIVSPSTEVSLHSKPASA